MIRKSSILVRQTILKIINIPIRSLYPFHKRHGQNMLPKLIKFTKKCILHEELQLKDFKIKKNPYVRQIFQQKYEYSVNYLFVIYCLSMFGACCINFSFKIYLRNDTLNSSQNDFQQQNSHNFRNLINKIFKKQPNQDDQQDDQNQTYYSTLPQNITRLKGLQLKKLGLSQIDQQNLRQKALLIQQGNKLLYESDFGQLVSQCLNTWIALGNLDIQQALLRSTLSLNSLRLLILSLKHKFNLESPQQILHTNRLYSTQRSLLYFDHSKITTSAQRTILAHNIGQVLLSSENLRQSLVEFVLDMGIQQVEGYFVQYLLEDQQGDQQIIQQDGYDQNQQDFSFNGLNNNQKFVQGITTKSIRNVRDQILNEIKDQKRFVIYALLRMIKGQEKLSLIL